MVISVEERTFLVHRDFLITLYIMQIYIKVKVKSTLEQATKAQRGLEI
jgi:hypothetical protein